MNLFMTLINTVLAIWFAVSSFSAKAEKDTKFVTLILTLIFIANAVIIMRG